MQLFGRFLPYPVQFEPICVLLVHAKTSEKTNFCTNGPMDTISVKSCATVADMRQNLDATILRAGFRQALQANCGTGYASPARTFSVANHTGAERREASSSSGAICGRGCRTALTRRGFAGGGAMSLTVNAQGAGATVSDPGGIQYT